MRNRAVNRKSPTTRECGVTPDTIDRDPDQLGAVLAKLGKNLVDMVVV